MIKIFGLFIVVAILLGLLIKVLWDLFLDKDGEKTTADNLIAAAVDVIIASLPSCSDSILHFLYNWLHIQKTVGEEGFSPRWLIAIGLLLLVVGVILKVIDAAASCVILNMPGTIHHTKADGMLKALKCQNCDEIETNTANCQTEMHRLSQTRANAIIADIQNQMERFNREAKSKRCFTGMAPIPFIIYAGTKHRGSDIRYYLEFNKATQEYTKLNNGKKFPKLLRPTINAVEATEIVVAVSTTAIINETNTSQFKLPVFSLSLEEPKDNAIFSKRQLNAYINETVTFISEVCKKNSQIKRVHLLLATQACFAYAFGKSLVLMQNRVPQIVSYHYTSPSYKVGITINGSSAGQIEKVKEVENV